MLKKIVAVVVEVTLTAVRNWDLWMWINKEALLPTLIELEMIQMNVIEGQGIKEDF